MGRRVRCSATCPAPRDIDALATLAEDHFGAPTSLMINNAGVGIGGRPVGEIGLADWQWALGINLWGMVYDPSGSCRSYVGRDGRG